MGVRLEHVEVDIQVCTIYNEEDSRGGKNRNTGERQQNSENQVSFNGVFAPF
jgi:hypothetical protein